MPSGTIIMPSGTIWHEFLPKLASVAPAAPGAGAPPQRRGLDRAPLASFGKKSGQLAIVMVITIIIATIDGNYHHSGRRDARIRDRISQDRPFAGDPLPLITID